MKFAVVAFAAAVSISTLAATQQPAQQQPSSPVTQISADRGSCKVDFRVTNMDGKPVYDAKIHTQLRWGFAGAHKLDLDIGTNADGRARFINMPNYVKNPVVFQIRSGSDEAMITWDPGTNCEAEYSVPLAKKGGKG